MRAPKEIKTAATPKSPWKSMVMSKVGPRSFPSPNNPCQKAYMMTHHCSPNGEDGEVVTVSGEDTVVPMAFLSEETLREVEAKGRVGGREGEKKGGRREAGEPHRGR